MLADTSGILASISRTDRAHARVRAVVEAESGPILVPDLVIAEVDHLVLRHVGRAAEEAFLEDMLGGGFAREPLRDDDLSRGLDLVRKYREHDIGIVDAVTLAVAERLDLRRILTLDERHFRMFRLAGRRPLALLPADALAD